MNVNDFENTELPEDMLQDIFKHQHQLALKYLPIEKANGLLLTEDVPVNLHDHRGQARIKDMFWRCTEEIAEAMEALDSKEWIHFYEELADAMHFLVECCIISDVYPWLHDTYVDPGDTLERYFDIARCSQPPDTNCVSSDLIYEHVANFVKKAGLACNCLKNKPWKQTQMLTDIPKFKTCMNNAFSEFIILCKAAGFNAEGLYNMYCRKHQVNVFRQRSGY